MRCVYTDHYKELFGKHGRIIVQFADGLRNAARCFHSQAVVNGHAISDIAHPPMKF
jgi:hypothetical protein